MSSGFTFAALRERTPELTGPERLEVFYGLPEVLQREAWADLAERARFRSAREFDEWCGDDR